MLHNICKKIKFHFEEAETWTLAERPNGEEPIDLETVTAHELGHVLDLGHSQDSTSLMWPYYKNSHRYLSQDDIDGIQGIYGSAPPSPPPFLVQIDGFNSALQGQERTYTAEVSGGQSPYSYEWYYYDDSDNPLANKRQIKSKSRFHNDTFIHTALNPSYAYIYLFVTASNGDTLEASKRIYVF